MALGLALLTPLGTEACLLSDDHCEAGADDRTACRERGVVGCDQTTGCVAGPGCDFVECEGLDRGPCDALPHCDWDVIQCKWSSTEFPSRQESCLHTAQLECQADPMCTWGNGCRGTPKHCMGLDQSVCSATKQCVWRESSLGM